MISRQLLRQLFKTKLEEVFDTILTQENLKKIDTFKWARDRGEFVELIQLYLLKGDSYTPCWGYSLKFCPEVSPHGRLIWHRTLSSTVFDLIYDPIDYFGRTGEWDVWMSYPWTQSCIEDFTITATSIAKKVVTETKEYFSQVNTIADFLKVYEKAISYKEYKRFRFFDNTRHMLSYAFLLKRNSKHEEAVHWLNEYIKIYELDADSVAKLKKAFQLLKAPYTTTSADTKGVKCYLTKISSSDSYCPRKIRNT